MAFVKKFLFSILGLAVLASPVVLALERQNLIDWWKLRSYEPSAAISSLAEHTTMNDLGRKLFYVHDPELKDKSTFGHSCPVHQEETIVLGCYITHQRIFIFDVSDDRLKGIEEVTAAHEMLHAAYDRLPKDEKVKIDRLTNEVISNISNDRIKKTIEAYQARDPGVVPNELHSILGTEVRDLPSELDDYYKKYFNDREKVVSLSEAYEAEFIKREQAIASYDQQLDSLRVEISGLEQELTLQGEALQTEQGRLFVLRANDPATYNQTYPSYNQNVQAYNSEVSRLRRLIAQYNDIVQKRNQIASEEQELLDAINSSLDTL